MNNNQFAIEQLESRFEMELVTLPNGQTVDVSQANMDAYAANPSCQCTSTCSPWGGSSPSKQMM
jgi:hypothetical protein